MTEVEGRIGVLGEKPLHASLKRWYARPGDQVEVELDGFVVDLVRGAQLIEIQSRGFSSMRAKLLALLALGHPVRIVHPIAVERWIVRLDDGGAVIGRRRSPRSGSVVDLAPELVSFPELLAHPGLQIEVLLTREEELRRHDPRCCWRRRGWTVVERRLIEVVDRVLLADAADLGRVLPSDLPDPFTTADLASRLARPRRVAQQLAYCLRRTGLIETVEVTGRAIGYRVAPAVAARADRSLTPSPLACTPDLAPASAATAQSELVAARGVAPPYHVATDVPRSNT